jgi:protein-S-isoprenylcysteine O-methyltransferase Ste14
MVTGALLTLLGIGLLSRSLLLLLYVTMLAPILQIYHVRTEEPDLVERFGQMYVDYRRRVPRWLPRLAAWKAPAMPGRPRTDKKAS